MKERSTRHAAPPIGGDATCGKKQPKLSVRQQAELVRMHASGEYSIADLMEVFTVGRATVYRILDRAKAQKSA